MENILKAFAHSTTFFPCMMFPSEKRPGKTDKIPCDSKGNRLSEWNKRENQMSAAAALQQAINMPAKAGISYVIGRAFDGSDNDWFVDIDKGLNAAGNGWSEATLEICSRFNGAAIERSQSGRGLHIYCKGFIPAITHNNQVEGVEIHGHKKFAVVTGDSLAGDPNIDCSEALKWLIEKYGTNGVKAPGGSIFDQWRIACNEPPHASHTPIATDAELISRMLNSAPLFGVGIRTLWAGSIEGYASASEATAALASHLSFWTGNDAGRMQRLMENSPAASTEMSAKWERWDILPRAILFARGVQTSFYRHQPIRAQDTTSGDNSQVQRVTSELRYLYPEQTANNKIINSTTNLEFLLQAMNITVRWNDMKHERELCIPNFIPHRGDTQNASLCRVTDLAAFHEFPITRIDEQLNLIAQRDTYHPLVECIIKRPWDGIPRLQIFIETIKTDSPFSQFLIRKWMLSTMGGIHSPFGWSQQGVLVLQGSQGVQKTRFVKALDPISCGAVREGAILDTNNKDHVITFAKHAIVEIAELDGTLRKNDVARLKAFITSDNDEVRFPYARKNTILPRRTSYIATVNDPRFLTDMTGNRRFHVIPVEEINLDHGLDMQQVWAEVEYYRQNGELTWLSKEESEKLNITNENYQQISSLEDRVLDYFNWESDWKVTENKMEVTCGHVLNLLGVRSESNSLATRLSYILKKHGQLSTKRRHYFVPLPRKIT